MNKQKKPFLSGKLWTACLIIFILNYLTGVVAVTVHEKTHAQVFYSYNSTAEIHINYLTLTGYTLGEAKKCNEYCNLSQNIVEGIGYHTVILIFTMWMIFLAYVLFRRLGMI